VLPGGALLIVGASARAAAGSALRAGFAPTGIDLFADADLAAAAPVTAIPTADYPHGFLTLARAAPPGPWLYTGGLENHPALVQAIAAERPLLGNDAPALRRARSPHFLADLFRKADIPHPTLFLDYPHRRPAHGRWLVKPLTGAGGRGIHFLDSAGQPERRAVYVQEYVAGEPCSAVYVGDGAHAELLGVTAQLVGAAEFHAAPFHYCGSIGPLALTAACQLAFTRLGDVIAAGCGLRGLFGVDAVLVDDVPYPVEVNPRYPASVEVLEHALGSAALARHVAVFGQRGASAPRGTVNGPKFKPPRGAFAPRGPAVGKAILYAASAVTFPPSGPWTEALHAPVDPWRLPEFADLPHAGDRIEAGRPILTVFSQAATVAACRADLAARAAEVERRLLRV